MAEGKRCDKVMEKKTGGREKGRVFMFQRTEGLSRRPGRSFWMTSVCDSDDSLTGLFFMRVSILFLEEGGCEAAVLGSLFPQLG